MAIIPVYALKQGGNSTRIYYSSGDVIYDSRKTKTVLNNIAHYFGSDLTVLRSNYGKKFNCNLYCPYPFSKKHVYVPIKVRSPFAKKDGATGYFKLSAFKGLELNARDSADCRVKCNILLSGEHRISSQISTSKIEERINLASSIREHYCLVHEQFSIKLKPKDLGKKGSTKFIKINKGLYIKIVTDDEEDD